MATRTSWKTAFPALLAHPGLSDYDRRVVEDMKRGYDRKGASYMTAGRRRYFHGIADRSAQTAAAMEARIGQEPTALDKELEILAARTVEGTWANRFVISLKRQTAAGRSLSEKQTHHLDKIREDYSDAAMDRAASFEANYRADVDGIRTDFARAVKYYAAEGNYYRDVVTDYSDDYVPSYKLWCKMVKNKYMAKVIAGYNADPRFPVGTTVWIGANGGNRADWETYRQRGKAAVVLSTSEPIISACKRNKRYKVLVIGNPKPMLIEERCILVRKPKAR